MGHRERASEGERAKPSSQTTTELRFVAGTLELRQLDPSRAVEIPVCRWDARAGCYRAPAASYAPVVLALRALGEPYDDRARAYRELPGGLVVHREPRPFQQEAVEAWRSGGGRGVVVLPTGAGKSHVAALAIDKTRRSTLIVVPTLDLVRQWYDLLRTSFGVEVGVVGGGEHRVLDLTVTTYDSAYLHMEHLGDRFGLVVFDECHHLPSESYGLAARFCLAPYRLGLTATLERADGREAELVELIGETVYRQEIVDLSGAYLADYEVIGVSIELTPDEREAYEENRSKYRAFLRAQGIRMGSRDGWQQFIQRSASSNAGREAMAAYREQRRIALFGAGKMSYVEHLLQLHAHDRVILFTDDNATAYAISRRFLVPIITHQTKVTERSEILEGFAAGRYRAVATSRVLNEGVDVPDANVAIVVSGTGSVREHVQRLGRVLRQREGKRALLYELVTADSVETFTSRRRREHHAYR